MRIAPSGRFSREAREPDQHHRSIWLLASPHCPDIQSLKPRAFGVLVGHISRFTWAKACVNTLPMSQNSLRTAAKYVSIHFFEVIKKLTARVLQSP
jgi:hypothetical protein